jgi:hypothetical protein
MPRKTEEIWFTATGQSVPYSFVPRRDKKATKIINKHIKVAQAISDKLTALRSTALQDITDFVAWSESENGVETIGGAKGNINLTSFDGLTQIRVRKPEYIEFDERMEQAKTIMFEYLDSLGNSPEAKIAIAIVTEAFTTTRDGRVRADAVLAVDRRIRLDAPQWRKAMALLHESRMAIAAKTYVRFYTRKDTESDFAMISLNIADA